MRMLAKKANDIKFYEAMIIYLLHKGKDIVKYIQ